MRCLDLFCGAAGGWTLGLHRAGWKTVAACEADPWRRSVFSHNWPEVVMFDDVRTLDSRVLAGLGPIDAIVGSPPCQDASTANAKGKGVDGERTGLFFDAVRLVREVRPRWVCFENVPGLRARGYDRVHDALEAAGYAVWPLVVGAWHAGAPHKRNRVWIIANLPSVGRGPGRQGRSDPGDARQPEQAFHDAHAAPVLGPALAGREPDGVGAGASADADGRQPSRPGRLAIGCVDMGAGAGGPDARNANGGAEGAEPDTRGGQDAESEGTARHPDGAGLALGQGVGSDARPEQPPAFGTSLRAWDQWNGGAPDLGRVDDGLSRALAARRGIGRACLAAYGDAVVPAITEIIGRAVSKIDRAHHELAPATAQGGDPLGAARFLPELPSVAPAAGGDF